MEDTFCHFLTSPLFLMCFVLRNIFSIFCQHPHPAVLLQASSRQHAFCSARGTQVLHSLVGEGQTRRIKPCKDLHTTACQFSVYLRYILFWLFIKKSLQLLSPVILFLFLLAAARCWVRIPNRSHQCTLRTIFWPSYNTLHDCLISYLKQINCCIF